MNESFEVVVSDKPFVVRRTVKWSDCDPARVVFTGKFTEYMMGAVAHFMRSIRRAAGTLPPGQDVSTPCKHLSQTFHISLVPDDVIDITVSLKAMREHSFDLLVQARAPDGGLVFEGQFSPICVETEVRRRTPIPAWLRAGLSAHQAPTAAN